MAIGIQISNDIKINIGDMKERVINDLEKNGISYEIPFDKLNKDNIKETIIHIKELDTEISIENDIVTYIKLINTEFSHLDKIENIKDNTLVHVKGIQEKVYELFNDSEYAIKIEKINTETMNMTVILTSKHMKVRVQIVRDSFGDIFINTIRLIERG